ncbi:MAG: serine/threonine protein phosphatase, partial [Chlorobi bacterium]|nr:serine/threonine protein phosphatase [Chlorobiota bacterium]
MKDTGRILVIPDIHGCKKTLSALLKKINLRNEDTLYFLGDYIDRGPDSSGVLDIITNLQKHYENIIPLCGNHEYQILNAEKTFKKKEFYYYVKKINKSDDLLNKKKKIKKKYRKFMESLAYFAETKDYFFVHAGFDFKKDNPFEDVKSMLNIRTFKYDRHKAKG